MTPALLRKPQTVDDFDLVRAEVERLRRRVALLEQTVAGLSRRRSLAPADHAWLARLLPAIAAAAGDGVWALPDLAALALLPGHSDLAAALAPRAERTGLRSLGKSLSRCADHPVGGFVLLCVGESRDGRLWQAKRI